MIHSCVALLYLQLLVELSTIDIPSQALQKEKKNRSYQEKKKSKT
jgi:hypothetical protein